MNVKRTELILVLGALTAFAPLSIDMYLPALPTLERVFATDAAGVQLTLAVFFLGFALGQAFFGPILVAAGWALSAMGFARGVDLLRHAGALMMVVGALLSVVGPGVLLRFLPAIGALVFLFPVPGRIRAPVASELQEISAVVAASGFRSPSQIVTVNVVVEGS